MSDPLRLRVLKALTTLLEGVTPTNGYMHDLAGKVFRGRTIFGQDDALPMLAILESPVAPEQLPSPPNSGLSNGNWELLIQGFVEDDKDNPTDPAHLLMAEVKKRLAVMKKTTGPGTGQDLLGIAEIYDFRIGAGVVRPPDGEISPTAYFWLNVVVVLAEDLSNP